MKVKIYGAGSIGNHLANAARRMGWNVVVCDVAEEALVRMREEIYPQRYGAWDPAIELAPADGAPRGGFDLICVGTPPEYHIPLAMEALAERPRAIQIEKPLCTPGMEGVEELSAGARDAGVEVFVGYDHVVGRACLAAGQMLAEGAIGEVQTIDVEFREHWGGIFKAHPWLAGPQDSYLGFWRKGGGASGEHSHALNLWQHFAHLAGAGRVRNVHAMLQYVSDGQVDYDSICALHLRTETGFMGRVVQDVITTPTLKHARIQGKDGAIEWVANYDSAGDAVLLLRPGEEPVVNRVTKTRPDDFVWEMEHIDECLGKGDKVSPLDLSKGIDTMAVVAAAHRSAAEGRAVIVN